MSEMIDIYNEKRELTGEKLPRKSKLVKGQYMLYVLALIQNREGKYLVTRRALNKKWAAGAWEIPGGGAQAGESSLEAVCREIKEEVGLDISGCTPRVLYSYCNEDLKSGDNYFADIYLCPLDFKKEDLKVEEEEVIDVSFADLSDIQKLHEEDGFLHFERICQAVRNL